MHITKGAKGFDLIKQVYSRFANVERSFTTGDYVTYTFDPQTVIHADMFGDDFKQDNLDALKAELTKCFAGKTIDAESLFSKHQTENMFARTHYTSALRQLYNEGKITAEIKDNKNHRESVLLIKECIITFK